MGIGIKNGEIVQGNYPKEKGVMLSSTPHQQPKAVDWLCSVPMHLNAKVKFLDADLLADAQLRIGETCEKKTIRWIAVAAIVSIQKRNAFSSTPHQQP